MEPADVPNTLSSSSIYSMLLSSLVLQSYSPVTTDITKIDCEYDYIIVGGGTAAPVVANRLSEDADVKILLLEPGFVPPKISEVPFVLKSLQKTYVTWNTTTGKQKDIGDIDLPFYYSNSVGGESATNYMFASRGLENDFKEWQKVGAKKWGYKEVMPYFKKIENFIPKPEGEYDKEIHSTGGPVSIDKSYYNSAISKAFFDAGTEIKFPKVDPFKPQLDGFFDILGLLRDGKRCSTSKAYLVEASKRPNLHILVNAPVTKILFEEKKAVGVNFDFEKETFEVHAKKEVILSAGAIRNVQLLMLSGIGKNEDLKKVNVKSIKFMRTGHTVQNYVTMNIGVMVDPNHPEVKGKFQIPTDDESIKQYINNGTGVLSTAEGIVGGAIVSRYFQNFGIHLQETWKEKEQKILVRCFTYTLNPDSVGEIYLQSSNVNDPPIVNINAFNHPADRKYTMQGIRFCKKLLSTNAFKNIGVTEIIDNGKCLDLENNDELFACLVKNHDDLIHPEFGPVGTTPIGDFSRAFHTVDNELRVNDLKNLRVVDESVIPKMVTGSPLLTTIMIAERGSDLIKQARSEEKKPST